MCTMQCNGFSNLWSEFGGFCFGEVMLAQLYCAYCFLSQQVNCIDQRYERVQNYVFTQLLKVRIED